jgi:hypothetical protein
MNQKDLYDETEPVDIFIKYNDNWSDKVLNK